MTKKPVVVVAPVVAPVVKRAYQHPVANTIIYTGGPTAPVTKEATGLLGLLGLRTPPVAAPVVEPGTRYETTIAQQAANAVGSTMVLRAYPTLTGRDTIGQLVAKAICALPLGSTMAQVMAVAAATEKAAHIKKGKIPAGINPKGWLVGAKRLQGIVLA